MTENKDREVILHADQQGAKAFEEAVADTVKDIDVVDPEVVDVEAELTDEEALAQMPTNIPYRKIFNSEGELANPITKRDPYRSPFMNRRQKRALIRKATQNPKNNKRGARVIITPFAKGKFVKTHVVQQRIGDKVIFHNIAKFNK